MRKKEKKPRRKARLLTKEDVIGLVVSFIVSLLASIATVLLAFKYGLIP